MILAVLTLDDDYNDDYDDGGDDDDDDDDHDDDDDEEEEEEDCYPGVQSSCKERLLTFSTLECCDIPSPSCCTILVIVIIINIS